MAAFTIDANKAISVEVGLKTAVLRVQGTSSYDTGGSVIDLSRSGSLGDDGFDAVYAVFATAEDASGSKYKLTYVSASNDAPATGKLHVRDVSAANAAEVASATNLSTQYFRVVVYGR